MAKLPKYVTDAIKSGPVPTLRRWQTMPYDKLTQGERVLRFAKDALVFPEGVKIGEPLELDVFQQAFILASFDDSQGHVDKAMLSMARRGGKTLVMAVICLAYIFLDGLARENTNIRSAAMTRDQSALLYRLCALICDMSPAVDGLYRTVPSSKKIVGLALNVEYQSLSRDAKSGHGQNIFVLVVDECGQIDAPNDDFLDMLFSSQGSYQDSKAFMISTQAPSDDAFFSVEMDTAEREQPAGIVCHLYTSSTDEIMSKKGWNEANPSIRGGYRSVEDITRNANEALRIPAKASGFLNLFMNRRVARESLWLAPAVWKENSGDVDWGVFRENGVYMGLDLSQKTDLTCAVIAAEDENGMVHVHPFAFTPEVGIRERTQQFRTPFATWAETGELVAVPGETINYEWVCEYLKLHIEDAGIDIKSIEFDRWRILELQANAERVGFAQDADWVEVGQGYKDISPRVEAMETALLQRKIRHGGHSILNLGASGAVVMADPANNRKIVRNKKGGQKIDGIIAMLMAIYPIVGFTDEESFDADGMIG